MSDILTEIGLLHAAYVEITGMEIRCDYSDYVRISQWQEFIRRGFTADDIKLVVFEIRRGITAGNRNPGALKFRNLIGNPDWFEEDLAEARANMRSRRPPPTEKDRLLKQTGRTTETASSAKPVSTVITALKPLSEAGEKAREEFCKLKEQLK